MPVGTAGAMKGLTLKDLEDLGADILLCNTYHLHIQPGEKVIREAGGLHEFIGWKKPILTDSGGFQVFSLSKIRTIDDDGVTFQSPKDGSMQMLTPESSIGIQHALGADMIMCFDECPPSTAPRGELEKAVERTLRWAARCKKEHTRRIEKNEGINGTEGTRMLFGIVQGGLHRDLRKKCAEELISIGFDGYAVGGLAVGESPEEMYSVLDDVCPLLPQSAPRYLMGVGGLGQLPICVSKGIDMFDCVLPVREARHGTVYLSDGTQIRMQRSELQHDHSPIDPNSPHPLCRTTKRSYLAHLFRANERYGETIAALQNLGVTLQLMRKLQQTITQHS